VPGRNTAAADLFDLRHTSNVLTAFGRAFGALPAGELNSEQQAFVEEAVAGLAQEGKVVCVRLALFAEMMKGKLWTPASLEAVGGAEGVGVTGRPGKDRRQPGWTTCAAALNKAPQIAGRR
jgi:eukaryotic-like serine/threonine-protein kinase